MRSITAELRRVARRLRQAWPLSSPVTIRRCPLPGCDAGDVCRTAHGFQIRLDASLDPADLAGFLTHEWAHIVTWDLDRSPNDHGPEFYRALRKIRRAYERAA